MIFKAKIYGEVPIRTGNQTSVGTTLTFTKTKIRLREDQVDRIYLDPMLLRCVVDKMEYDFDKILNKDDKKQFSIILRQKLNALDKGVFHLEISLWNKIRANIIHHRYFIDRQKEELYKILISAAIGFVFAIIGHKIGFNEGYRSGIKDGQLARQSLSK